MRSVRVPSCEEDLDRIADEALVRGVVVRGELRVLAHFHARAQRVHPRIGGDGVLVVRGRQPSVDQRDGDHVLDAMVAVGGIRERARLVDDAHARLLRLDHDALDRIEPPLAWSGCRRIAHSTAVCAWNSAGKLILNSTFSMT